MPAVEGCSIGRADVCSVLNGQLSVFSGRLSVVSCRFSVVGTPIASVVQPPQPSIVQPSIVPAVRRARSSIVQASIRDATDNQEPRTKHQQPHTKNQTRKHLASRLPFIRIRKRRLPAVHRSTTSPAPTPPGYGFASEAYAHHRG